MEKIISRDNPKIKQLKKLGLKKYREQSGLFLIENWVTIRDGALAGSWPEAIFITSDFYAKNKSAIAGLLDSGRVESYLISEQINKSFSALDNPSGVVAVYRQAGQAELDYDSHIIYLNSVNDPGNLGSILRSALAFGFNQIVLDDTCVDLYNPKVVVASKDAIFKINIHHDSGLKVLKQIKKRLPIVATIMEAKNDIGRLPKSKPLCLVLGSEAHGVSDQIKKLADQSVKIKMSGDMESLGVAASAAIIFYHLSR